MTALTPHPTMPDKSALRQQLADLRRALDADLRAQWDSAIGEQVDIWLTTHPIRSLGVYWPIRAEPDLRAWYAAWSRRGIQLALPVVIDKDMPLQFLTWAEDSQLNKDSMGVMVPHADSPTVRPDAILTPCVGYNRDRIRLGYGGGFYDRTLATTPRPIALGIAYSATLSDFTAEAHDIALDAIVTEQPGASLW